MGQDWHLARDLYLTLEVRAKLRIEENNFVLTFKGADLLNVVSQGYRNNREEATRIKNSVNTNFAKLMSSDYMARYGSMRIPIPAVPSWIECFGVQPSSAQHTVEFKKGQMQFSTNMQPGPKSCDSFQKVSPYLNMIMKIIDTPNQNLGKTMDYLVKVATQNNLLNEKTLGYLNLFREVFRGEEARSVKDEL